jgi:hypothetical protein
MSLIGAGAQHELAYTKAGAYFLKSFNIGSIKA